MQAWALFLVYGTYYGLTEPVEKALVRDVTTASERTRAYGVYNFVLGACALPAGLITGFLWQTYSPRVALAAGSALAAVASLALLIWGATTCQPLSGPGQRPRLRSLDEPAPNLSLSLVHERDGFVLGGVLWLGSRSPAPVVRAPVVARAGPANERRRACRLFHAARRSELRER